MLKEKNKSETSMENIYTLDGKVPFLKSVPFGLQHVLAMFVAIVSALMFVSIFNFVNAGRINASLAEKQITIAELQASISDLKSEYNKMTDDGYLMGEASNSGFVESNSSNTTVLEYGETYAEPVIEELPSNWFNDVCDFFSNLFAA